MQSLRTDLRPTPTTFLPASRRRKNSGEKSLSEVATMKQSTNESVWWMWSITSAQSARSAVFFPGTGCGVCISSNPLARSFSSCAKTQGFDQSAKALLTVGVPYSAAASTSRRAPSALRKDPKFSVSTNMPTLGSAHGSSSSCHGGNRVKYRGSVMKVGARATNQIPQQHTSTCKGPI